MRVFFNMIRYTVLREAFFLIQRIIEARNQVICCCADTRNFTSSGTDATRNVINFENE